MVESTGESRELKDGQTIHLRHFEGRDVDGIWDNFGEVIEEGLTLPIFSKVDSDTERRAWYHEFLIQGQLCLIAEDSLGEKGRHVVGQCTIENSEWDAAKHVGILGIIVRSDFRNKGVGAHLIAFSKEESRKIGKEKLNLSVFANNASGIHLYEKLGFVEVGRRPKQFFMNGAYVDEVLMDCVL
ncbi:MAG TPA: GNAT family N-acetyltransferase [Candidatus Lokiarchaeia archaeon]|nr:GNAT family N-acetyltransferase [Candidatus Lokiarchaeia archaeon]